MRTVSPIFGAMLVLAALTPLAAQETSVVSRGELDAALTNQGAGVDADRAAVGRVLTRPDVEAAVRSAGMGSELEQARAQVGTLQGDRLARAAAAARALEVDLAGGQTIVFSTTTLIIILLLIIVIILIAD
jgi:hypothetical protein